MWAAFKQHFKDTALTYIFGTVLLGTVVALLVTSWHFIEAEMEAALLNTFGDALTFKDPNHNPDGTLREANFARSIEHFQASVADFVGKRVDEIDKYFIGYVQSGTFTLPYVESQGRSRQSFQIFAGDKTHVYLEFNISPFDSDSYNMQLMFFEQPVCSAYQWQTGLNVVEFEVTDVLRKKWRFLGDCKESGGAANIEQAEESNLSEVRETPRTQRIWTGAHERQLIPVRLLIIDKTRTPRLTSFGEAVRATASVGAQPVGHKPDVTVGYVVVVSPFIQDAFTQPARTTGK